VPEATVKEEVASRTLATVQIEDRELARPLAAIHTRAKALTPAMKQFIALLKEPL
jgi:DNA-binding transcriptional LysR family regulator